MLLLPTSRGPLRDRLDQGHAQGTYGHEEGTAAPVGEWHRCQQVIYLGGWWSG